MKKLCIIFACFLLNFSSKAQYVSVDDPVLLSKLTALFPGCFNGDQMDTTCDAIRTATHLDLQGAAGALGIYIYITYPLQYFHALQYLNVSHNSIGAWAPLIIPENLDTLICTDQESEANINPFNLEELPALPPSLRYLDCSHNSLRSLPALPAGLQWLDCSNQLRVFDTYTFVPCLPALPELPSSLVHLNCKGNALTSLPILPSSLTYLDCGYNKADIQGDAEIYHYAGISCLPYLPASLDTLKIYGNNLNCIPNLVPGVFTDLILPVCSASNNSNGCFPTPLISGNIFFDGNSNAVMDAGELPAPNVRVDFSNGQSAFTDVNGHYSTRLPDIGNYTATVYPPAFYNAVPPSFNYSISDYNTTVTESVALQPNAVADSMKITITPLNTARPGMPLPYDVKYQNVGTTTLNANIVVNYDNGRLVYTNSSNALVTDNGSALNLSLAGIIPGQTGEFTANFLVSASAVINDTVFVKATVTCGASTGVDSTFSVIRASFDPNYKQATPALSTSQVNNGDFINYLIGFQNTGTDTAFNIVLTDTLTAMLQANTVQIIEASHPCTISQNANTLAFEFLNIKLPDMTTNEIASHGFVRFRLKAQPFLTAGTLVPNKGSIYFDYNTAVPTGIANTTIYEGSIVVPVKLSSFTARKQNEAVQLNWITEEEINSKEFVIERSSGQNKWNQLLRVNAAGNSSQKINYTATDFNPAKGINYYRLKQVDLDGRFTYSETRSVYFGNDMSVVLAPNPAKDKMTIYLPGNTALVSVNIYNSNDQLVKTISSAEETIPVNVGNLSKGIYTVKITGKNIKEVKKLFVQ